MVLRTITTLADTITSEAAPSTNYTSRATLTVRNVTNRRLLTYIIVRGLPSREGAVVTSATLRLFASASFPSATVNVRRLTSEWAVSRVTWAGQPAGGAIAASSTGSAAIRTAFDIDVTTLISQMIAGTLPNYGMRLETTSTRADGVSWYSMNADGTRAAFRPVLLLDISYPPNAPDAIQPTPGVVSTSDPVLSWRYSGEGAEPMVAYQVQANVNDAWTSPSYDSGEVASSEPSAQLMGVDGDGRWFRIRHKAADGRWSAWSQPQQITFSARPTVTITSTDAISDDPTPTTTWTVSGGTQRAYQVRLLRDDTGAVLADSGVLVGTETQWAPSRPLSVDPTVELVREVRVWDAVDRVATSGQTIYTQATWGTFRIEPTATVTPVADLEASTPLGPVVDLSWTRATTPDSYIIERRIGTGPWRRIAAPDAGEVALGSGAYSFRDVTAPPEHDLTYRVRAVVNKSMSEAPFEATAITRGNLIWLADPSDPDWLLPLAGSDDIDWTFGEDAAVHVVPGADRSHLVHEGSRGYEGTVGGRLFSEFQLAGNVPVEVLRERFWELKRRPTHVWRLVSRTFNIPAVVYGASLVDRNGVDVSYGVTCSFIQQGELPWDES